MGRTKVIRGWGRLGDQKRVVGLFPAPFTRLARGVRLSEYNIVDDYKVKVRLGTEEPPVWFPTLLNNPNPFSTVFVGFPKKTNNEQNILLRSYSNLFPELSLLPRRVGSETKENEHPLDKMVRRHQELIKEQGFTHKQAIEKVKKEWSQIEERKQLEVKFHQRLAVRNGVPERNFKNSLVDFQEEKINTEEDEIRFEHMRNKILLRLEIAKIESLPPLKLEKLDPMITRRDVLRFLREYPEHKANIHESSLKFPPKALALGLVKAFDIVDSFADTDKEVERIVKAVDSHTISEEEAKADLTRLLRLRFKKSLHDGKHVEAYANVPPVVIPSKKTLPQQESSSNPNDFWLQNS